MAAKKTPESKKVSDYDLLTKAGYVCLGQGEVMVQGDSFVAVYLEKPDPKLTLRVVNGRVYVKRDE